VNKEQKENYLSSGGVICPYYESTCIEGRGMIECDAGIAWQDVNCNYCDKEWRDLYKLINVEEL